MVEKFGEGLLIVLFELVVLVEQFFLFLLVLELQRCVLEDIHDYVFGLLFQKNVADAQQPR